MNRLYVALTVAIALAFVPALAPLQAAPKDKTANGVSIPISATNATGDIFDATFNLQRFAVDGAGKLVAVGTVAGTATSKATGLATPFLQTVTVPVILPGGATANAITIQQADCEILNLVLGPLHLDVLGLVVDLNQVVLNITAVPGAGNLLGNLLCAVAGLLDNPAGVLGQIANLLNQILAILQGL